jgi:hypothetical protein
VSELTEAEADGIVLATFEPPALQVAELVRLGFPTSKIVTLFPPIPPASDGDGPRPA